MRLRGIVVSAKRRRTYGTSSIGRTRYDAVDRAFYDAIKTYLNKNSNTLHFDVICDTLQAWNFYDKAFLLSFAKITLQHDFPPSC